MEEGYSSALMLLAIGMITVLFILSLVVFFGGLLIRFINKFFPEPEVKLAPNQQTPQTSHAISPAKMAAIVATVDLVTEGRGSLEKVDKAS